MSIKQGRNTIAGLQDISGKANVDMDNLTSAGANIANWSSNVTNCITEIPQDIKLELNNGTLTLKAGSKVYVPNGVGVFDEITIASDLSVTPTWLNNNTGLVFYYLAENRITATETSYCVSGSTAPTYLDGGCWYDTTNNKVKKGTSSSWTDTQKISLPIAVVKSSSNSITSIDQVFNGFGYIGSTVFALPGVKGLIPNGRNEDGTLKNIEITVLTVQTASGGSSDQKNITCGIRDVGRLGLNGNFKYLEQENKNIDTSNGNAWNACPFCVYDNTSGKISNFAPKTVFHAVNYNEADFVVAFQRPTAENNYTWYRKYKDGWVEQGGRSFNGTTKTLPVVMADTNYTVTTSFTANTSTNTMQWQYVGVTKSTTSISRSANGIDMSWYVAGMAA